MFLGAVALAAVPTERLSAILAAKAEQWNTSFSLGVFDPILGSFGAVGGLNDRRRRTPMDEANRFPVGSVTKPYTASAVMRAYERGLLDIDAPIARYVDPILTRENGTTLLELFAGDRTCLNITARMLMGMRSGLQDYNDSWYHAVTLHDGGHDVSPYELLWRQNKTFMCAPGACGQYCSTGFELLGLALAQVSGARGWRDYDQASVFPPDVRKMMAGTAFPGPGPCSDDPLIVHQYASEPYHRSKPRQPPDGPPVNVTIVDIRNNSCLNGWTCGNIAATTKDIAHFHQLLHAGRIVNETSLAQMMDFKPMRTGWSPQMYGLAMMQTFPPKWEAWGPDPSGVTRTMGHAGADYGSLGMLAGINIRHGFGIAFATGTSLSLNHSLSYPQLMAFTEFFYDALCPAYDEVLRIVTGGAAPRLNCSACPNCPFRPPDGPGCAPALRSTCPEPPNGTCMHCVNTHKCTFRADGCSWATMLAHCGIPPNSSLPAGPAVNMLYAF